MTRCLTLAALSAATFTLVLTACGPKDWKRKGEEPDECSLSLPSSTTVVVGEPETHDFETSGANVTTETVGPVTATLEPLGEGSTGMTAHQLTIACSDVDPNASVTVDVDGANEWCQQTIAVNCVDEIPLPTGPTAPTDFPPHSTDCAEDAYGCLVPGSYGCSIQLDAPAASDVVTVVAAGTMADAAANGTIDVAVFTAADPYTFEVPQCSALRRYDQLERSIVDDLWTTTASDATPIPDGDLDLVITCSMDLGTGTATMTTDGPELPEAPVQGPIGFPSETGVILALRNAALCGVRVE